MIKKLIAKIGLKVALTIGALGFTLGLFVNKPVATPENPTPGIEAGVSVQGPNDSVPDTILHIK